MSEWTAKWVANPESDQGRWELYRDGMIVDAIVPFATEPAGTFGTCQEWGIDHDDTERWDSFHDGIGMSKWVARHVTWLHTIAPATEWDAIYRAFQHGYWDRSRDATIQMES